MQPKHNAICFFIICISAVLLICACGTNDSASNAHTDESPATALPAVVYELDLSAQQDVDLSVLANYPELQQLNLNGLGLSDVSDVTVCTDLQWLDLRGNMLTVDSYNAIRATLPACEILWDVPIADKSYDSSSAELTLPDVNEKELQKLTYFTNLEYVDATSVTDIKALSVIRASMPQCKFDWNVTLYGQVYPSTTQQLDLRSFAGEDTSELQLLTFFSELESVDLRGWTLELATMNDLAESCASTSFLFSFSLAGVDTDSTATELDISGHAVTSPDDISSYLRFMPNLTYLDMCNCGLSNEEMAGLRDSFPNVKFVWKIQMGQYLLRTDVVAFSTLVSAYKPYTMLTSDDLEVLKYCTDLKALDLGHHKIVDLTHLSVLTDLRVLILADNFIEDLTPLSNLRELRYLEVFLNPDISSLEPLASLENLVDLNCGYIYGITDFSPLYGLDNLERVWLNKTFITEEALNELIANLPEGCEVCAKMSLDSTGGGWRNHDRHYIQMDMFRNNYIDDIFFEIP